MYMILASLYESAITPVLIMSALPFAAIGAFIALWLTGESLNIFSMIALVLLLGLVAKNSILLVDYTYQLMRRGRDRDTALIEAGKTRLRPILMTTASMGLGVVPLIIASGAGAISRRDIGIVIAAGMTIGTLFTLFVIPSIYMLIAQDHGHDLEKPQADSHRAPSSSGHDLQNDLEPELQTG
jgi:multidrug efflux pump